MAIDTGRPGIPVKGWRALLVSMVCVIMMAGFRAAGAVPTAEAASSSRTAVIVNGTEISVNDFRRELERIKRQRGVNSSNPDDPKLAEVKREALENLINRELLFQESVRQKISIATAVLDKEMASVKGQFGTPEQFAENLQRIGMNENELRLVVGRGLAIRQVIELVVLKDVVVSEKDIQDYYDQHIKDFTQPSQVRLSHILVETGSEWPQYNSQEATDKISPLLSRLRNGEEFAQLAATYSDCKSKSKGGDIGWFTPGQLTPEIEKAVALLKVNEISGIVEDRFGLHIIKVVERKSSYTPELKDNKEKVRGLVKQNAGIIVLQRFATKLRDAAKVELLLKDSD